ncbi:MAG: hypothetical protein GQ564_19805 [Bacteroidales bacterium]|nr:hypothetical protein [Bacteroidales bacterium]
MFWRNKKTREIGKKNHTEHIFGQKFIEQKLDYIHNNPVKAAIVANPQEYLYSRARNYAYMDSIIEIIKADRRWKTI